MEHRVGVSVHDSMPRLGGGATARTRPHEHVWILHSRQKAFPQLTCAARRGHRPRTATRERLQRGCDLSTAANGLVSAV